jgi:nucleotide-binding universal stress UspA family protein
MSRIVAAIDNSSAARPVLGTAVAVARLLGGEVVAVHVRVNGERVARSEAEAAGIPLQVDEGDPVERLAAASEEEDVVALVLGARGIPPGPRPAGSTAVALITSVRKPVVVVPPDMAGPARVRRLLVPLEGTWETSSAPHVVVGRARQEELDVVCLHVRETVPPFADQPKYEAEAWAEEFLARYWPGPGVPRLETRIGLPRESVLTVADDVDADAILLGWSQALVPGRAPVVREVLERGRRPVALVPLVVELEAGSR